MDDARAPSSPREAVRDALARATRALAAAGVDSPRDNAEMLLGHVLDTGRGGLLARSREDLARPARERFDELVRRRAAREPLQHLLGRWPFLELELKVDARALIPRPETEDLALLARARLPRHRPTLVADVGTGTGCLALALASGHPAARVIAIEVDAGALSLAAENLGATDPARGRVQLVRGDLLAPVVPRPVFDLVVANLPYVAPEDWPGLQPEVREFDPERALVAPEGGLALIRALVPQARARIVPGGSLLLEMAPDQAPVIAREMTSAGWTDVEIARDHLGRDRVVSARPAPQA